MPQTFQSDWAQALLDAGAGPPKGVISHTAKAPHKRFAIYKNNVMAGLIGALAARFPAARRIVGEDCFDGLARVFAAQNPPRSPLMMTYGDEFPDFLACDAFAEAVPYLADVARIEAARTRAYHAQDAQPLDAADLAAISAENLANLRFVLHPSLEIIASPFPVVTIWAMNAGERELAEIADWSAESALVIRPALDVEVRPLRPGAEAFLNRLAAGECFSDAAGAALAQSADFDLAANLANLFTTGLAVATFAAKDVQHDAAI